jgi:hypothetical protein
MVRDDDSIVGVFWFLADLSSYAFAIARERYEGYGEDLGG